MRPKTIQGELKEKIGEALKTKSRKEICTEFKVSYQQLRQEFGAKWKHTNGEEVKSEVLN